MPIPSYQELMLPVLKALSDRKVTTKRDMATVMTLEFHLNQEECKLILPSGSSTYIENRTGWAVSYLKQAGLLYYPSRGKVQITESGLEYLKKNPSEINNKALLKIPTFAEFIERSRSKVKNQTAKIDQEIIEDSKYDPEEMLYQSYEVLRSSLAQELLEKIQSMSPAFFEQLVVDLMLAMGYGGSEIDSGQVTALTGDEGIDGIIKEDKLGLDQIYLQAKRWDNPVSRPEIQKFVGALQGKRAKKGVFITTSRFTQEAVEYSKNLDCKVVLIDGQKLAELMITHDVGVQSRRVLEMKKVDEDYFS